MIWLLYALLVANACAVISTLEAIIDDRAYTDRDCVWCLTTILLTPINIIWLAQL